MEFNARYTLIGTFSVLVILAIFSFLYWLSNAGGFGTRAEYQVRFSVPVSGIAEGGNVLFNGLKVGEISKVAFDPEKPSDILAFISVEDLTPVRADTKAGVDYQGITGAPNILLTGGTSVAEELPLSGSGIPEIIAKPEDSRSWTQSAGRVLNRIDSVFHENRGRLSTILSGLERLTGGDDSNAGNKRYDLRLPEFPPLEGEKPDWQLVIAEPTILLTFNTDRIQEQVSEIAWEPFGEARWTDNVPNLFQTKIIQSFENAGFGDLLANPSDILDPQFRLAVDIRWFHVRNGDHPITEVDLVAKILDEEGGTLFSHRFQSQEVSNSMDEADVIESFNRLFVREVSGLVEWTVATL
ncbi:MAG: ABC-type transport auxiliary lipoprotein family protein [Rhizobiaceae bacterium]